MESTSSITIYLTSFLNILLFRRKEPTPTVLGHEGCGTVVLSKRWWWSWRLCNIMTLATITGLTPQLGWDSLSRWPTFATIAKCAEEGRLRSVSTSKSNALCAYEISGTYKHSSFVTRLSPEKFLNSVCLYVQLILFRQLPFGPIIGSLSPWLSW